MSTVPSTSPETTQGYMSLPSTRWDAIKYVLGFGIPAAGMAAWALIAMFFNQQTQTKAIEQSQSAIVALQQSRQQGREEVLTKLAGMQATLTYQADALKAQGDELKTIREDIKALLQKGR